MGCTPLLAWPSRGPRRAYLPGTEHSSSHRVNLSPSGGWASLRPPGAREKPWLIMSIPPHPAAPLLLTGPAMGVGTHAEVPGAPWRPPDPSSSPAGLLHQHGQT